MWREGHYNIHIIRIMRGISGDVVDRKDGTKKKFFSRGSCPRSPAKISYRVVGEVLPTTPVRDFSRSTTLRDAIIYDLVATMADGRHGEMGFERSLARTYFEAVDNTDLGLGTPLPADSGNKTTHKKGRFLVGFVLFISPCLASVGCLADGARIEGVQ